MPSVGTAYVNIRVNTKGFEAGLDRMMKRLSTKMEKAGTDLGKDFERGLKKTNFDSVFNGLTTASGKASDTVANDINKITTESREAKSAIGDLSGELRDVARSSRGINLGGVGGGSGGMRQAAGDAGFLRDRLRELSDEAPKGTAFLNTLFNTAAFGGTALAGLVGGLSGAAQGIFAVGANAAAAAPALGIFATGLIGLAQVGATVGISMMGVGKAITAGTASVDKAALATGSATKGLQSATKASAAAARRAVEAAQRGVRDAVQGVADAARGVQDARRQLREAYQDAARAAADAARRVVDAEHAMAAAQRATAIAQKELNAARAEGIQQLKEIGFAAEDASLAEDRAALNLADAQQALVAVSELAPDDRSRVEAELAFQEADLQMREAKNRREQADKDQRKAAKTGVEGTDAMISAHEAVASAQQDEADAARDLNDARREQAQTAQDSARSIADAQRGVANAQRGLADAQQTLADAQRALTDAQHRQNDAVKAATPAMTAAAKAADAYQLALDKLSPNQREFVKLVMSQREHFMDLRRQIADPLFGGLTDALRTLINSGFLDQVAGKLTNTSGVLGDLVRQGADTITSPPFSKSFLDVMDSNNRSLGFFGRAAINLGAAFVQVADAASPLLEDFAKWTEEVTKSWRATAEADNKSGKLGRTIQNGARHIREFWGLATELWRTLRILGGAANKAADGFGFIDQKGRRAQGFIPMLTDSLDGFNDKLEKNPDLVDGFTQSLRNMVAVGGAIKTVVQPFIDLGQDPQVAEAFNTIAESDAFERLGKTAGNALPELADIVVNLADFLADISESNAIDHFLDVLVKISAALATFSGWLNRTGILKYTGYVTAAVASIRLLWKVLKIGTSPFVALGKSVLGYVRNVKTARAEGKGFFKSLGAGAKTSAFGGAGAKVAGAGQEAKEGTWESEVLVLLRGIITAVETCCVKLTATMSRGAAAGAGGELLGSAPRGAAGAAGAAGGVAGIGGAAGGQVGKVGKFAGVMGKFGKVLGPATKLLKPLSFGIRALGAAFRFALGPIGLIVFTVLPLLWPLFVKIEQKTGIFSKTFHLLGDAFEFVWDKMKDLFGWVKSNWPLLLAIIAGPIGLAVLLVIKHWDRIIEFIKKIPARIKNFLTGMWDFFMDGLRVVVKSVRTTWGRILAFIKGLPRRIWNMLKNVWGFWVRINRALYRRLGDFFRSIISFLRKVPGRVFQAMKKVWNVITDKLRAAWDTVKRIWSTITRWVKGRPEQFRNNLKNLWNVFIDKLHSAWTKVQDLWRKVKNAVGNWPGQIKKKLSGLWDGISGGIRGAYNTVARFINKNLIGGINSILGRFGASKITFRLKTLAEGGPVEGPGGPKSDRIPAMLSNGEYVLPTKASRMIGRRNLDYMRKTGKLPGSTSGTGGADGLLGKITGATGWLKDKAEDLANVMKKGEEAALKWVIGKFKSGIGDGIIARIALAAVSSGANKIISFGRNADEARAAAAAARASSSGSGPAAVWRALRSVGFSKIQTAGVMGNMQSESGFDPFIVQGGGHSMNPAAAGGGGYGLVQWTPGKKLIPYLRGKRPSINSEINALAAQLRGRGSSPEGAAGRRLRAANTITEATLAFELGYERHAGGPQPSRISQAMNWYKRFKGSDAMQASGSPAAAYTGPAGGWTYPLGHRYSITQRPNAGHNPSWSVDIGAPGHTLVRAASAGVISKAINLGNRSYGRYIEIEHRNGVRTLYAHLERFLVHYGQRVRTGQRIGWSDSTGHSTGNHLHFEYKPSSSTIRAMAAHGVRLARGGVVAPTAAGTLAVLAEAGKHERVTPLDKEGFTPAERRMLEVLESKVAANGKGDTFHVHPAPGMNEAAVADMVSRRVAWKRRRGAGWR